MDGLRVQGMRRDVRGLYDRPNNIYDLAVEYLIFKYNIKCKYARTYLKWLRKKYNRHSSSRIVSRIVLLLSLSTDNIRSYYYYCYRHIATVIRVNFHE